MTNIDGQKDRILLRIHEKQWGSEQLMAIHCEKEPAIRYGKQINEKNS